MPFSQPMISERDVDIGGLRLRVASGPAAGPPLVLLHGVVRRWQDFVPLLPALAWRWQVQALDFRGHGGSARAAGRYLVADYARDVAEFLTAHVREPAVIYGHSLGALVAAAVAARAPDAVRGVVLEDPPAAALLRDLRATPFYSMFAGMVPLAGSQRLVGEVAAALADVRTGPAGGPAGPRLGDVRDASSLRFSARCLRDLDPDVLTPLVEGRWLDGYEWEAVWRGVRCPALLLCGDEGCGGMLARAEAGRMARAMADCTLVELPGVGHLIHWMETATTVRLVTGFLETL
jgi:pimeloyl-ACP methyl ester carboxylesterase